MTPKWFNVNEDARVWSSHAKVHKMGWMRAGSAVLAVEEYGGSFRFEEFKEPSDLVPLGDGYNDYWIPTDSVTLLPFEEEDDEDGDGEDDPGDDPDTGDATDARLGRAIRVVLAEGGAVAFGTRT
jgi:hypothetical protein